jgi:hypothetical protein
MNTRRHFIKLSAATAGAFAFPLKSTTFAEQSVKPLRIGSQEIMSQRIRGVLAPVVTPFKADLSPDSQRFIAHCKWLLS